MRAVYTSKQVVVITIPIMAKHVLGLSTGKWQGQDRTHAVKKKKKKTREIFSWATDGLQCLDARSMVQKV